MQANDITRERLRRLAGTRPAEAKVLSLFLSLDPREFATPPARGTEVRSLVDRVARMVREDESLTHAERASLRGDLERVQAELGNSGLDAKGAHGLAVFAASAAGLFEVLKLSEPVDHEPVIADAPFVEPLSAIGAPERWCAVLVNRRTARLFCGPGGALDEIELIEDDVHRQHDQGGWSQANYQRSVEKEVADHLRRAADVAFAHLKDALPAGILVGAPQELAGDFEAHLHPYLRERLAGRLEIDVENSTPEDVRRAASPRIGQATVRGTGRGARAPGGGLRRLLAARRQRPDGGPRRRTRAACRDPARRCRLHGARRVLPDLWLARCRRGHRLPRGWERRRAPSRRRRGRRRARVDASGRRPRPARPPRARLARPCRGGAALLRGVAMTITPPTPGPGQPGPPVPLPDPEPAPPGPAAPEPGRTRCPDPIHPTRSRSPSRRRRRRRSNPRARASDSAARGDRPSPPDARRLARRRR